MALIDNAIYVNGRRAATPKTLDETYEVMKANNGFAWIGMYRPSEREVRVHSRAYSRNGRSTPQGSGEPLPDSRADHR